MRPATVRRSNSFLRRGRDFRAASSSGGTGKVARCEIDFERDADDFAYVGARGFAEGGVYLEAIASGAGGDEGGAGAAIV